MTVDANMLCKSHSVLLSSVIMATSLPKLRCDSEEFHFPGQWGIGVKRLKSTTSGLRRYPFMALGGNSGCDCRTDLQVWGICSVECVHILPFLAIIDVLGILPGALT